MEKLRLTLITFQSFPKFPRNKFQSGLVELEKIDNKSDNGSLLQILSDLEINRFHKSYKLDS